MARQASDKQWEVAERYPEEYEGTFSGFHDVIIQLLFNRGFTERGEAERFLFPDFDRDIHDPFLFRDMERAVKRIVKALHKHEKVIVYGDYDADGVCSASLLTSFFQDIGLSCDIYLPHRETEGYGLNLTAIDSFIEAGVQLIITVDCGTTNIKEIEKAKSAGIDVIVIDHHHVPEVLPPMYAFLNCSDPNDGYPFPYLAGVGMAYKFVQGIIAYSQQHQTDINWQTGREKWLLDLVAIATVTDLVPLIGENHVLVKYGLTVLNKTKRLGLQALKEVANLKGPLDAWQVGFVIGPRLNAAGRLDHANGAYVLLTADNQADASRFAQDLQRANQARQQLTDASVREAKKLVQAQVEADDKVLVVCNKEWELGIVGLIAGRLVENYQRPAFAVTESQGKIKGSGRSIPGFNIIEAVERAGEFLEKYGGHDQACGFTASDMKALNRFAENLKQQAAGLSLEDFKPSLRIDMEVPLMEITWELYQTLQQFAPFGQDNPQPRFLSTNLQVIGLDFVGDNKKHMRLMVGDESGLIRKTIGFGLGEVWGDLAMGDRIDMVYEVGVNEWNGNRELQLKIVDLKPVSV